MDLIDLSVARLLYHVLGSTRASEHPGLWGNNSCKINTSMLNVEKPLNYNDKGGGKTGVLVEGFLEKKQDQHP